MRKYYRESQNAEHLCNSSVSGPDSPVTQSANTRQQVEDLLASNRGSLLRTMAAQNKSLANLQMETEGLDQTLRNLSEKVRNTFFRSYGMYLGSLMISIHCWISVLTIMAMYSLILVRVFLLEGTYVIAVSCASQVLGLILLNLAVSIQVCGGHGNLTDNSTCPKSLCGGSGCKDNEGQRHCGGEGCSGTVSAAARALTKANNVTQNINIVNEELDVVAKKVGLHPAGKLLLTQT